MTLDWNMLQKLLIIAIACSTITVAFIQKTKKFFKKSTFITTYSFLVNMIFGFIFSRTFTDLDYLKSLWVGLFSFIGADTIYKNLEGKLSTYTSLRNEKEKTTTKTQEDVIGEIPRD